MTMVYPISSVGELIGEPARAAMLIALLDGRDLTAGELALLAGISPQSASAHLSKLVDGALLKARSQGRHRYYRLSGPEIGHALEALGAIATRPRTPASLRSLENMEIYRARSCYDHLAGRIAVELAKRLETLNVIRLSGAQEYQLGPRGQQWFAALDIDANALHSARRTFARRCLDWTERKPHLAGALGAALFSQMLTAGWIVRRRGTRALRVTHRGATELQSRFGLIA